MQGCQTVSVGTASLSTEVWPRGRLSLRELFLCDVLRLAAAADGFSGFFVGGAAAVCFAFVPELLAFGQG